MSPRPHLPEDPQAAGSRLPPGFELWLAYVGSVAEGPGAEAPAVEGALAASVARRRPAAVVALSEAAERFGRLVGDAAGVAAVHGGAKAVHAALERCRAPGAAALAVVAADDAWRPLLVALLGMPPDRGDALRLDAGRASCLVASSHGWLLACHNVRDPGAFERREEGLGRPA